MKIHCCYTPAHEVLFEKYFKPSLPPELTLVAEVVPLPGPGDFLSAEFLECIRRKIALILESIRKNPGEIIIWSDVDILLLDTVVQDINTRFQQAENRKLLFQQERKSETEVNTGFIAMRCCEEVSRFFEEVHARLGLEPEKNEQAIVNEMLAAQYPISWQHLPLTYYARSQGWPPPTHLKIYHANATKGHDGIGQKVVQLKEILWIQKNGFAGLMASCLQRIWHRLARACGTGAS